jgi:hypothetical protein
MNDRFNAESPLYDNLCDGIALNDYRLLAESERYLGHGGPRVGPPLFTRLAAFIAGRGGERRDRPIYELCHLIAALAECGICSEGERLNILLGLYPVTPATIRAALSNHDFVAEEDGLAHGTGEDRFFIYYRRAVYLFAIHEFLSQMEGCAYFGELNDIFETMLTQGADELAIRNASNAIARRLARYRRAHFDWSSHADNFTALIRFLKGRETGEQWRIDDETIFEFWCYASSSGRFREYRTCFDAFTRLIRALENVAQIRNAEGVKSLEQDFDGGLGPAVGVADYWDQAEWDDPLVYFDEEALQGIKFFKTASERKPLAALMHYGPQALTLTHAFLRLEVFSAIQSAIGNDLRAGRGPASIARRLVMGDTPSYRDKQRQVRNLRDHVSELMKAVLHVIGSRERSAEMGEMAERTFRGMRRKGFEKIGSGELERLEAFEIAADKLPLIFDQLNAFLARTDQLGDQANLEQLFESDKRMFHAQLQLLYGNST